MLKFNRRRKGGFTLIELLVVVLILAILMAVALPLYLSAIADAEKKTCRSNMQTIATAVRAYQVKNRDKTLQPTSAQLVTNGDLSADPHCPSDTAASPGAYTIAVTNTGAITITCPVNGTSAHGSFSPGMSS